MNKIKDLIYDYNDIFVALLIIVVAGAMLLWRVNAIMEYPEYLAEKSSETQVAQTEDVDLSDVDLETREEVDTNLNENPEEVDSQVIEQETQQEQEQTSTTTETASETTKPTTDVKFEVPKGSSASKIADLLRQANLIEDQDEFLSTLKSLGAETKIKAGSFTIPAGSTDEDIIKILTK